MDVVVLFEQAAVPPSRRVDRLAGRHGDDTARQKLFVPLKGAEGFLISGRAVSPVRLARSLVSDPTEKPA
jgi:hypothetical protein